MDDIDVQTGNLLRAWREHRQLTQEALAERVGTTHAVISLLESGDRKLSPKWLHRLAPALQTTPGRLLDCHPDNLPALADDVFYNIPDDRIALAREVLNSFRVTPKTGTDD